MLLFTMDWHTYTVWSSISITIVNKTTNFSRMQRSNFIWLNHKLVCYDHNDYVTHFSVNEKLLKIQYKNVFNHFEFIKKKYKWHCFIVIFFPKKHLIFSSFANQLVIFQNNDGTTNILAAAVPWTTEFNRLTRNWNVDKLL